MAEFVSLGVILARKLGGTVCADEFLLCNEGRHGRAL